MNKPSGTTFTLGLIAALCADGAPVWALALVGIAGLTFLVWGVSGGKRHKKSAPGVSSTKSGRAE